MLENMFSNVGPKIRRFAMVSFVVESIAAVLGGLALILEDLDAFFPGLLIIIVGIFSAYWVSVFIAGIGENIESTTAVKETNQQILAELKKLNQKTVAPAVPAAPAVSAKPSAPKEPEPTWTCYSCKTENPVKLQYCTKCHAAQSWSQGKNGITAAPAAKAHKTLREHLVFASNYSTAEGMQAYLSRVAADKLNPDEKHDLAILLAQPDLRAAIRDYLEQNN